LACFEPAVELALIDAEAKEHWNGFVDWKIRKPVVARAPRSERGDREPSGSRQVAAKSFQKRTVEGSLGDCGVEVDLKHGRHG
jgi:hypothetical protein